jgi:hypothetical protein
MLYWKILAPAALAAAGVIAAALLTKKLANKGDGAAEKPAPAVKPAAKPYAPKAPAVGSYSFISGFQDAATVELSVPYDKETGSFAVLEDEFPAESGDSHVAVLYEEGFSLQLEYASYYRGEDFGELQGQLAAKHSDLAPAVFGANAGVRFLDGDNLAFLFPILDDPYSYLHVTLMKASGNDDTLEEVAAYPALAYTLSGLRFERR